MPNPRWILLALTACVAAGCGDEPSPPPGETPPATRASAAPAGAEALPDGAELVVLPAGEPTDVKEDVAARIRWLASEAAVRQTLKPVVIDYPFDATVFPPGFTPPTFYWHDENPLSTAWLLAFEPGEGGEPIFVVVEGAPPPRGEIDELALGETNEVYELNSYQASSKTWTPSPALWQRIQELCRSAQARMVVRGFRREEPTRVLSEGQVTLRTAEEAVDAPIFYRDVPLMPDKGESGLIQPLASKALPLIAWRLRDVTLPESRLVMTGMPSCGNCHSFSSDGKTFGMDVDGPQGDKGTYAIADVSEDMVIEFDDIITWNSFPEKPEGHKTIGFLSRVSPDGRYVVTTVNEALYVANFTDYRILQVFFPTRGMLAVYDQQTGEMKSLPGADDPAYVHCTPVWTPDGKTIVFSRAKAFDPYVEGQKLAVGPNDPNEPQIRYDLYRIPFDEGKGGTPEPVRGASENGKSNSFPKVSPDGRWIVWVKAQNGLLLRPDGKLWIVPAEGGVPREMECNLPIMNSWHSFSPNGRWMVWTSKSFTPYTQMFLTHLDEEGHASPAVLIPRSTAANRASNLPEFLNADYDALKTIDVPAVEHQRSFWEGVDLIREERYEEAAAALRDTLAKEPTFSRAHVNLGYALASLGQLDEAMAHYEQALALSPTMAVAHNNLGLAKSERGDHAQAIEHFEEAVRLDPFNFLAEYNLGLALSRAERPKDAVKHFQRAIELNPTHALSHNNLGYVLFGLGEPERAIVFYRTALKHDPSLVRARKNLAHALGRQGDEAGALAELGRALESAPEDPGLRRAVGRILCRRGAYEEGLKHLEASARFAPENGETHRLLAWHLATAPDAAVRDGARALTHAERAVDLAPASAVALDALAAALAEVGRFEEAVTAIDRAIERVPEAERARAGPAMRARRDAYAAKKPWRRESGSR